MRNYFALIIASIYINCVKANLIYNPISFEIQTDKESYYEGEKITFNITITNTDKEQTHPVLLPHTQNTGQKLFYLSFYDKANNTHLLRYREDKMLNMMVHDTGTVQIRYLKPLEQIVIPIYLNDFENYYSYHTQNASHHSMGVPLFAGIYKVNLTYNPKGIPLGDHIYSYYGDFDKNKSDSNKLLLHENGALSQMIDLKIKRSSDTVVSIQDQKFFIKTDGYYFYYFNKYVETITTDTSCIHISSLLTDSASMKGEYFYNQFPGLFNEYIARFEDGDIREYRKFRSECPDYLYTERFNELKQKTQYQLQLSDGRFYSISYHQPSGKIDQEILCVPNGTRCDETKYIYNKHGDFIKKKYTQTEPCAEVLIDGKLKSYKLVYNLELKE